MPSLNHQPKKKEGVHRGEDVTADSSSSLSLSLSSSSPSLDHFFEPVGSYRVWPLTESFPTGEIGNKGTIHHHWDYGGQHKYTGSEGNAKADNDCIFKQAVRLTGKIGYKSRHAYGGDGPIPMRYGEWAWSAWIKINKPLQGPVYLIGVGEHGGNFFGWSGANGIFLHPTDNKITVEHGEVSFFVDFDQFPLGSWNHIMTYTHDHGDRILYINGRKIGSKNEGSHGWWGRPANTALKAVVSTSSGNDISVDLPALLRGGMDNPDKTASKLYQQQASLATNASKFFDAPLMPTRFLPSQISSTIRRQIPIEAVLFPQKKQGTWAITCMGRGCENAMFTTQGTSIRVQAKGGIPPKEGDNSNSDYGGSLDCSGKGNTGMIMPANSSHKSKLAQWLGQPQWAISGWIYVKQWGSQPFILFHLRDNENPSDSGQVMVSLDPVHHTLQILDKGKTHKITNLNVSKTLSTGVWHHIMLRRKSAKTLDVLLDGHKVNENFEWTKLPPSWWGNTNLFINVAHTQDSETHVRVDRLMFWNIHPSTSTVQTYIQNTAPQTYSSPAKIYYTHKGGGKGGGGTGGSGKDNGGDGEKGKNKKNQGTAIIIGVISVLVVGGVLLFLFYKHKRKSDRPSSFSSSSQNSDLSEGGATQNIDQFI